MTSWRKLYDKVMHYYETLRYKLQERRDVIDLILLNLMAAVSVFLISTSSDSENRTALIVILAAVVFGIIRKIKLVVK